jgi:UDP-N-acetylmuramate: L-alanyl-gamma-D-glutamyl-meso-diaminopimelate ligase
LHGRWVLAVAGTHGKTTTTSMLTWILDQAGMDPGYLVGGVPKNFSVSARLGTAPFFVIEADEYDSAFFDKRSKFIHYLPRTVILGNLEFDHADIFRSIEDIQIQFQHFVKTIPASGRIVLPDHEPCLEEVLAKGVYSEVERFGIVGEAAHQTQQSDALQSAWKVHPLEADGSKLRITHGNKSGEISWEMLGRHNMLNACAAVAAAAHAGVPVDISCEALSRFGGVKRRLELIGTVRNIRVYDDFAHHPTAIKTTLGGLRARMNAEGEKGRLLAAIEARSNTMKMGYHQNTLAASLDDADAVLWYRSQVTKLDLDAIARDAKAQFHTMSDTQAMVDWLSREAQPGDHIVVMSNGGFEGLHQRLLTALSGGE